MSLKKLYNQTAVIERYTKTADGMGGNTIVWVTSSTDVKCRVQPLAGDESIAHSRVEVRITHKVYCATTVDVLEKDRIVVDELTLRIHTVRDIDRLRRFYTIECEEERVG